MCFLSPLVEVGTFAFLATELDDAAESAMGGVADQPKTTATVGAPLHAILPSLRIFNPPDDAASAVRSANAGVMARRRRTSYAPNYSGRASISVPGKIGATGETTLI